MTGSLRNLESVNEVIMDNLTKYILEETDIETDFFYQKGEKKGLNEKSQEVVKNLLAINQFGIGEIARIAGVSESFVREVQETLK